MLNTFWTLNLYISSLVKVILLSASLSTNCCFTMEPLIHCEISKFLYEHWTLKRISLCAVMAIEKWLFMVVHIHTIYFRDMNLLHKN